MYVLGFLGFSKESSHKFGSSKAGGSKGGKGFHSSKGHEGGDEGSHGKKGAKVKTLLPFKERFNN